MDLVRRRLIDVAQQVHRTMKVIIEEAVLVEAAAGTTTARTRRQLSPRRSP